MFTVKKEVASAVDTGSGKVKGLPENEKGIAQTCVNCREPHIFAVYFWNSEGWKARNEALPEAGVICSEDTSYP